MSVGSFTSEPRSSVPLVSHRPPMISRGMEQFFSGRRPCLKLVNRAHIKNALMQCPLSLEGLESISTRWTQVSTLGPCCVATSMAEGTVLSVEENGPPH